MKQIRVLLGLTVFWASAALASEAFVLNIPLRFNPQQETGEVRVRLFLDVPPGASQLVVNGATTLDLGDTVTVAGDSVSFLSDTGNTVRIVYKPLSNFNADFCDAGGAQEKNIPMRFAGAPDIVRWEISSYVVGSPGFECSQVSKRSGDQPANLVPNDDGVAPALDAVFGSRLPLDVTLVLDKSGSMSELPPGSNTGPTKADILQSALNAFISAWSQIDAPTGSGAEWSDDRIGDVFFSSTAAPQALAGADPPANFFLPRGSGNAWSAVSDNINTLSPSGSTSIGAGINEAMSQWKADPDHDLSMIVVTDGKQNTAPLIAANPGGVLELTPVAGLNTELRKRFIPIQTIGFGTPDAVDANLLTNLSLQTSGVSYLVTSASTMFDTFAATLVSILKGNTVSLATRQRGTMTGPGPGAATNVTVDPSAQRVMFMLQWAPPVREALDLEVFRPGSSTPAVPDSHDTTPQSVIHTFNPGAGDLGEWSVRVKRRAGQGAVPYTLNVLVLERHLDYRIAFDQISAGTGDSIKVHATIAYDGKPLTKLPAGAVRVRIQRPADAYGNILHDTAFSDPSSGNTMTPSGDVQTPYDRKVTHVTDAALIERVLGHDVATIALDEEGKGVYSGTFDQTTVPGIYGFEVTLDWTDPRTGHVHREERHEMIVKVKPDPSRSAVAVTRGPGDTRLVTITPRDRFGNYLGPGFDSLVTATTTSGTLSGPLDRDQTGTYVYTVSNIPAGETPEITVNVDGVELDTSGNASSSALWRLFLDAGANFPHGGLSVNGGIERIFSTAWSLEGIAGHHSRDAGDLWQFSVNAKRYFGTAPLHPFLNFGGGFYRHEHAGTEAGVNAGIGLLYDLSPKLGVEGAWNYHALDNNRFSAVQIGVRFALQ